MPDTPTPAAEQRVWHDIPLEQIVAGLATRLEDGLSAREARRRLSEIGPNELREQPPTPFWRLVLQQFGNFVVLLLIVASAISIALGDYIEASAIMAIVLLNAVIGVTQEARAERALAALKKLAAPDARVIRDGHHLTVPSSDLVPGDVVLLEAGNFVPADVRLIRTVNLSIDESALTGESVAVDKEADLVLAAETPLAERRNLAFMSTTVSYGRGAGLVVETGMRTQIGLIAEMLQTLEETETPLQRRLDQLGRLLGYAALAICGVVFGLGILRGVDPLDMFIIAVSLAIAAVPEGLPAVVTITLALGMREMLKRHALIRRLSSVETLGSASVICSDKTGTLTQNQMTAVRLWAGGEYFKVTGRGYSPQGKVLHGDTEADFTQDPVVLSTLTIGVLANDALLENAGHNGSEPRYRMVGAPTEGALVVLGAKAGLWREQVEDDYPRVAENPFDSERKMMSTVHVVPANRKAGVDPFRDIPANGRRQWVACVKGAPDFVLQCCTRLEQLDGHSVELTPALREEILQANASMSEAALRVLAVAYRPLSALPDRVTPEALERDLTFAGLIGMIDPARPEVESAIDNARMAGIRTVMITGDAPTTAQAIARSINLLRPDSKVVPGWDLDKLSDEELTTLTREADAFARVSPHHKVRLVEAFERAGAVVAMTGDGVNDAPALKRADIGVAMGIAGTDVSREAADMVLTDDNYASIVAAVEQGRIIYANIRKFVFFLLSSNVAEIMIIFLAMLFGLPTPLTAIQLLWLNLITDGAPALALALEQGDPDVMQHPPRPKNEPIINGPMRLGIVVQTITQTCATLLAFGFGLVWHAPGGFPAGENPVGFLLRFDWSNADVRAAVTMGFVTLSLCELFRAYTVRSERLSLFLIGIFANKFMQPAVLASIGLLLLVVNVPFLQPIFDTQSLALSEWALVLGLALIPALSEEFTKLYLRLRGD